MVKVRLVNGEGTISELPGEESISLGALGIASTITLRVIDMYWLEHKASAHCLSMDSLSQKLQFGTIQWWQWVKDLKELHTADYIYKVDGLLIVMSPRHPCLCASYKR